MIVGGMQVVRANKHDHAPDRTFTRKKTQGGKVWLSPTDLYKLME